MTIPLLGDAWAEPLPRPEVPTNDRAIVSLAEAKRARKAAARLAKAGAK